MEYLLAALFVVFATVGLGALVLDVWVTRRIDSLGEGD